MVVHAGRTAGLPLAGGKTVRQGTDDTGSARIAFEEGMVFEARGDLKRALASFKVAAERAPRRADCAEAVARVLESMGKIAPAMDWYMRAAQMRDDESNAMVAKPKWFYDLAEERKWAQGLQPNSLKQEEVAPAIEHLERLIAQFGPDSLALRKLALLLARLARFGEATQLVEQARMADLRGTQWP
jgi:tetratricopeptide (TPR) repeat protein